MKSIYLVPYCPLPVDTGAKTEMRKHLEILKRLGNCKITTASKKPVGCGWTDDHTKEIEKAGDMVLFREDECRRSLRQIAGMGYAAFFKSIGMDKAFGHSNPYHRYAFPADWWRQHTYGMDLAVINYSYWAWLPCECPKVVVLHDLLSDFMWEGPRREIEELSSADLVVVISKDEEARLNERGVVKTLWSPPAVEAVDLPLTDSIGCVGSANKFNIEGLRWLEKADSNLDISLYGSVAACASSQSLRKVGRYAENLQPYKDCGIMLLPTSGGMGVQIKAIESLAYGRAIVARKGAMRGLPPGHGAWLEVDQPADMIDAARALQSDSIARERLSAAARTYYSRYLDSNVIKKTLRDAYLDVAGNS